VIRSRPHLAEAQEEEDSAHALGKSNNAATQYLEDSLPARTEGLG
jgi:hypothetical protein